MSTPPKATKAAKAKKDALVEASDTPQPPLADPAVAATAVTDSTAEVPNGEKQPDADPEAEAGMPRPPDIEAPHSEKQPGTAPAAAPAADLAAVPSAQTVTIRLKDGSARHHPWKRLDAAIQKQRAEQLYGDRFDKIEK